MFPQQIDAVVIVVVSCSCDLIQVVIEVLQGVIRDTTVVHILLATSSYKFLLLLLFVVVVVVVVVAVYFLLQRLIGTAEQGRRAIEQSSALRFRHTAAKFKSKGLLVLQYH